MAVSVDATAGSATANSYASVAEADAYLEARFNASAWANASSTDKMIALIEATRELDRLTYQGFRTTSVQALSWPRRGVINTDAPQDEPLGEYTGYPEYDDDIVPVRLKNATIELALEFLRAGSTDIASVDPDLGVIRKKIDVIETEWSPNTKKFGLSRYPRVISLVTPLLVSGGVNEVVRS